MIITFDRLGKSGRLGNQLWQIASTAGIADTLDDRFFLPLWDYRPYFKLPEFAFNPPDGNSIAEAGGVIQAQETPLVNHIDPRARDYLQDLGLWGHIAPQIWSWFQPSPNALDWIRSAQCELPDRGPIMFYDIPRPILSVHIRRGDNAQQPNNNHPLRPWSYYEESIARLSPEVKSIVVFSDDPEWCRAKLKGHPVEDRLAFFVGTPRAKEHEAAYRSQPAFDWRDLQLMSMCDRHIISNSTYSWWGAFLSHDPSPIYPWPFFGSELEYIDCGLMFPDSWTRIDHGQQYV